MANTSFRKQKPEFPFRIETAPLNGPFRAERYHQIGAFGGTTYPILRIKDN
jgi:hypothetical protein